LLQKNIDVLNTLLVNDLNQLKNNFDQMVSSFEPLSSIEHNQITSHHHNVLNNLSNINNILKHNGIYTQLKLTPNIDDIVIKLKKANEELKEFKPDDFEKAIVLVGDLNQKKAQFESLVIKENLGSFINRANEHRIYINSDKPKWKIWNHFSGKWIWLFFATIMAGIIMYIIHTFIDVIKSDKDITIGIAILRVSSLIVPSYFMVFFINQFNYHKKLYEAYSFKNTSLSIMTELMKVNSNKADFILEKGLNVLFTEPQIKEDIKYDKELVNSLINVIKKG
jgi:hypothetical protein